MQNCCKKNAAREGAGDVPGGRSVRRGEKREREGQRTEHRGPRGELGGRGGAAGMGDVFLFCGWVSVGPARPGRRACQPPVSRVVPFCWPGRF